MFAGLGAYALHFTPFGVFAILATGVVGFFMRRFSYPGAPMDAGVAAALRREDVFDAAFEGRRDAKGEGE